MNAYTFLDLFKSPKGFFLVLITIFCLPSTSIALTDKAQLKAERIDASTFPGNCNDCCDTNDLTDCQFNEALSLLDVIVSDIDALTTFEETCCANMTSSFTNLKSDLDALTTFEQTCCANMTSSFTNLKSDLDALTTFEQTCCANMTSSFTNLKSNLDALTTFEQTCCSQTIALLQSIATPVSACTKIILQADIPYTTTAPGRYCLGSNVTYSGTGAAITINNPGVVLELNGYGITLSNTAARGILINNVNDVAIRDGIITGAGGRGIQVGNMANLYLSNLDISGMSLGGIRAPATTNFVLANSIISVPGASGSALDCGNSNNVLIQNSILNGGLIGISITSSAFVYKLDNLIVAGATSHGIQFNGLDITMKSVSCDRNGGNGLDIQTGNTGNTLIQDCQFSDNALGGVLITQSSGQDLSFYFNNCVAQGNFGGDGFRLNCTTNSNSILGMVFDSCSSSRNSGSGYNISNFGSSIIFKNCVASYNSNDGFSLNANTSLCDIISCIAIRNSNNGFNNGNPASNFFANNSSTGNSTQYNGVTNTTIPTTSTGFWANAFFP